MANTSQGYTPGSGGLGAVDRIGGVDFPRVKPQIGAEGIANSIAAGAGAVDAGVQRMTLASDDPAVVALGSAGSGGPTLPGSSSGVMGLLRYLADLWRGYTASAAVTRPNDTTAYAANDVIGAATGSTAALTFSSIAPSSGGDIMITQAALRIDASAVISGEANYRLHLYSQTPPSAYGDNTAWDLPSGDRSYYLGYLDLGTPVDMGATLFVQTDTLNRHIKATGSDLYGYLVTLGGYTPTAQRVHTVVLHAAAL